MDMLATPSSRSLTYPLLPTVPEMPPLPLNDIAFEAFRTLKAQGSGKGYVFLNTKGDRLRDARDWFEPAVKKSGLEDYTWHCNRHTFASWLVMAGGYPHCCATDGTSYNSNDDAVRTPGSRSQSERR
jgi:hypothetical protein